MRTARIGNFKQPKNSLLLNFGKNKRIDSNSKIPNIVNTDASPCMSQGSDEENKEEEEIEFPYIRDSLSNKEKP